MTFTLCRTRNLRDAVLSGGARALVRGRRGAELQGHAPRGDGFQAALVGPHHERAAAARQAQALTWLEGIQGALVGAERATTHGARAWLVERDRCERHAWHVQLMPPGPATHDVRALRGPPPPQLSVHLWTLVRGRAESVLGSRSRFGLWRHGRSRLPGSCGPRLAPGHLTLRQRQAQAT